MIIFLVIWEFKLIIQRDPNSIKGSILAIGILGTFVGIFIGLQDFDSSNIEQSIGNIINGLTIAFYTSIIGMGATIILTLLSRILPPIEKQDNEAFNYLKNMANYLNDLNIQSKSNHDETIVVLKEIKDSIVQTSSNQQNYENIVQLLQDISNKIVNNQSVYELVEDINKNVINLNSNLTKELKSLSADFTRNSNSVNQHIDNLGNKVETEFKVLSTDFARNSDQISDSFKNGVSNLITSFEDSLNTANDNFKQTIDSSKDIFKLTAIQISDDLKNAFKDFNRSLDIVLDNIAEKSTNEIAKALKFSMDNFNNSLAKNFGENFKRLDDSVKKMVEWQDNYLDYIIKSQDQLSVAIQVIKDFEQLMSKHEEMVDTYKKLEAIIQVFDAQATAQTTNLSTFAQIAKDASSTIPNIQAYFKNLENLMANMTNQNTSQFKQYENSLAQSFQITKTTIDKTMDETKKSVEKSVGYLTQDLDKLEKVMNSVTAKFANEYETYIEAIKKLLQTANNMPKRS